MPFDDDEPVFKRSKWGTNRYEYNPRNPIGFALIILAIAFASVVLLLMHNHAGPFAYPTDPTTAPDTSEWIPPAPPSPSPGSAESTPWPTPPESPAP